jgi:hypothetical protein
MREEVGGIRNQDNKTTLNLGEPANIGKLEQKSGRDADNDSDHQTAKEDQQEDTGTLEEADDTVVTRLALVVLLSGLEDDNGNGVVEDGFAKDDGVELGIDLVCIEDGEDCNWIGGRQGGADGNGIDKGHVDGTRDQGVEPQDQPNDDGGQEGASKGKGQDGADVTEEVGLV